MCHCSVVISVTAQSQHQLPSLKPAPKGLRVLPSVYSCNACNSAEAEGGRKRVWEAVPHQRVLGNSNHCLRADWESFGFHIINSTNIYFHFSPTQLKKKKQQEMWFELTE
jgi:hypothetical protein